jgi:hypothetical protein
MVGEFHYSMDKEPYVWYLLKEGLVYDLTQYGVASHSPDIPHAWTTEDRLSSMAFLAKAVKAQDSFYRELDP